MTKNELGREYFEWMYRLVNDTRCSKRQSYRKLLYYLNGIDFTYILPMDENRAVDGVDLRYRFGYERSYEDAVIESCLDDRPCSVLEMLVALAVRCEEQIMDDMDAGNRTPQWFWGMIFNLGLRYMDDGRFDLGYANNVTWALLNRKYKRNGEGGLFTVERCGRDLRSVEIWYQMCWYLDSVL